MVFDCREHSFVLGGSVQASGGSAFGVGRQVGQWDKVCTFPWRDNSDKWQNFLGVSLDFGYYIIIYKFIYNNIIISFLVFCVTDWMNCHVVTLSREKTEFMYLNFVDYVEKNNQTVCFSLFSMKIVDDVRWKNRMLFFVIKVYLLSLWLSQFPCFQEDWNQENWISG